MTKKRDRVAAGTLRVALVAHAGQAAARPFFVEDLRVARCLDHAFERVAYHRLRLGQSALLYTLVLQVWDPEDPARMPWLSGGEYWRTTASWDLPS